jgi:lipoate-protein ligase A
MTVGQDRPATGIVGPERRAITLVDQAFVTEPGVDTGVSRALLQLASEGSIGETFRLYTPAREVAFGKRDAIAPGFGRAVAAARTAGYEAIERLAGGRAAVFHPGTLAFAWTIPDPDPPARIKARFDAISLLMAAALGGLGIDARIGEVPGEYCPGDYSVNAAGKVKLVGVGQRLARRAAHVGGVVVVTGDSTVNAVLTPVYAAMDLAWNPCATGAVDVVAPGTTVATMAAAIVTELHRRHDVRSGELPDGALTRGRELADEHVAPG